MQSLARSLPLTRTLSRTQTNLHLSPSLSSVTSSIHLTTLRTYATKTQRTEWKQEKLLKPSKHFGDVGFTNHLKIIQTLRLDYERRVGESGSVGFCMLFG